MHSVKTPLAVHARGGSPQKHDHGLFSSRPSDAARWSNSGVDDPSPTEVLNSIGNYQPPRVDYRRAFLPGRERGVGKEERGGRSGREESLILQRSHSPATSSYLSAPQSPESRPDLEVNKSPPRRNPPPSRHHPPVVPFSNSLQETGRGRTGPPKEGGSRVQSWDRTRSDNFLRKIKQLPLAGDLDWTSTVKTIDQMKKDVLELIQQLTEQRSALTAQAYHIFEILLAIETDDDVIKKLGNGRNINNDVRVNSNHIDKSRIDILRENVEQLSLSAKKFIKTRLDRVPSSSVRTHLKADKSHVVPKKAKRIALSNERSEYSTDFSITGSPLSCVRSTGNSKPPLRALTNHSSESRASSPVKKSINGFGGVSDKVDSARSDEEKPVFELDKSPNEIQGVGLQRVVKKLSKRRRKQKKILVTITNESSRLGDYTSRTSRAKENSIAAYDSLNDEKKPVSDDDKSLLQSQSKSKVPKFMVNEDSYSSSNQCANNSTKLRDTSRLRFGNPRNLTGQNERLLRNCVGCIENANSTYKFNECNGFKKKKVRPPWKSELYSPKDHPIMLKFHRLNKTESLINNKEKRKQFYGNFRAFCGSNEASKTDYSFRGGYSVPRKSDPFLPKHTMYCNSFKNENYKKKKCSYPMHSATESIYRSVSFSPQRKISLQGIDDFRFLNNEELRQEIRNCAAKRHQRIESFDDELINLGINTRSFSPKQHKSRYIHSLESSRNTLTLKKINDSYIKSHSRHDSPQLRNSPIDFSCSPTINEFYRSHSPSLIASPIDELTKKFNVLNFNEHDSEANSVVLKKFIKSSDSYLLKQSTATDEAESSSPELNMVFNQIAPIVEVDDSKLSNADIVKLLYTEKSQKPSNEISNINDLVVRNLEAETANEYVDQFKDHSSALTSRVDKPSDANLKFQVNSDVSAVEVSKTEEQEAVKVTNPGDGVISGSKTQLVDAQTLEKALQKKSSSIDKNLDSAKNQADSAKQKTAQPITPFNIKLGLRLPKNFYKRPTFTLRRVKTERGLLLKKEVVRKDDAKRSPVWDKFTVSSLLKIRGMANLIRSNEFDLSSNLPPPRSMGWIKRYC